MKLVFLAMIVVGFAFLCEAYPYKKFNAKLFFKCVFCFRYFKVISKEYKPKDKNHIYYNFIENFLYYFKFVILVLSYTLFYSGILLLCLNLTL
ncbi:MULTISPECIES: hypothetical protein [unclassified Campylobacter]|uniref:hypothetical protein n=1 Tax=unclassified Campylobacter TaxID=2593542 RepID=UPI001D4EED3A|nr:hypothetical protein [Campylobacter sp. RM9331]MBZ8006307.1 hypothetical protein [Campylobacter sp. RM9332]